MKALVVLIACSFLFAVGAQAAEHETASGKTEHDSGTTEKAAEAHHGVMAGDHEEKGEHRDNTALFPQPKADIAKGTNPAAIKLVSPSLHQKISGTSTTLKWEASPVTDTYHVQVATDPNFKWLTADEHYVKGTSFEAKDLEKGKAYYWRVAPWKEGNMAGANKGTFAPSAFEVE